MQSISGNAVKGVIINGIVSAYVIDTNNGSRQLAGQTRTDATGQFELTIARQNDDSLMLFELSADQETSMLCDVMAGCLTLTGNRVAFGESFHVADDFFLMGTLAEADTNVAFISPLSHITITTAATLPGGLSQNNVNLASGLIAQTFNLESDPLSIETPDLTALSTLDNLTDQQLKQAILGASFFELMSTDQWRQGQLDLELLPLKDLFHQVSEMAQQLADKMSPDQSTYTSALFAISSEARTSYGELIGGPLTITGQPQSVTVNEGDRFVLHVDVTGDGPLRYQWRKNNVDIVDATLSSYNIPSASIDDIGSYSVQVSNSGEIIESLSALVVVDKVLEPVSIVQQPLSQTITEGDSFSLAVAVTGDGPFSYQWQKAGSIIPDAITSNYSISNSTEANEGSYRVTVTNAISEVTSEFATIVVNESVSPVVLVTQPQSVVSNLGAPASFRVDASGGGFISYQWYKDDIALIGAHGNSFNIAATSMKDAGNYYVTAANSRGSVVSGLVSLTVLSNEVPVVISKQPQAVALYDGDSASLSISATGDGALTYQWRLDGRVIVGANQASYAISNASVADAGSYTVEVRSTYSTATSLPALVTVDIRPTLELSWDIPTQREDGSPLELYEIGGYVIEYGYGPSEMKGRISIDEGTTTHYQLTDRFSGAVFLRIATIDTAGLQGSFSDTFTFTVD